ncbi:MAG: sigma 54-interacting transcriptional regulator [Nitrospiraceae bacterium]|nr:MAG: sigma 54-interacting transcriptional regulator [Nitrospiraceae bacterium]
MPASRTEAYKYFFNTTSEIMCIAGLDGYLKLINPSFERILGYSRDELFAKPFFEFIHPDDRDKNIEEVRNLKRGETITGCEHRYICKNGTIKWLVWTSHTNLDDGMVYAVARDVTERKSLEDEISSIRESFLSGELQHRESFSSVITCSKKMIAIFHYIEAVARSDRPVFVTGETGVGKELIVAALHNISNVKGNLVSINAAGLDDSLFSDTLFGHKKGAYTGADRERKGLIVRASGGSLHLDEVGDLSELSQVKLLRLLEEGTYYPLGADMPEQSDARIIASSNRNLQGLVSDGLFRQDLYYRLCTHSIVIPPLRDRKEDIPLLLDHFIQEASRSLKKKKPVLSRELISLLSNYHFPGNIRELQAMVYDAVAQHKKGSAFLDIFKKFVKKKGALPKRDLPFTDQRALSFDDVFGHFPTLKETEEYLISDAMKRAEGNQGIAATLLGISRQALNRRLKNKK